jgi:hypothetical protein
VSGVSEALSATMTDDQHSGGGTNMTVNQAVDTHLKYLEPLWRTNITIGSPAVTNSNDATKGRAWLAAFMKACEMKGCHIGFIAVHWYAWAKADEFKQYLENIHREFGRPVWVTEMGVTEGNADVFLCDVLPWLDQQGWIERYAYHMVAPATASAKYLINAQGTGLSSTGSIYVSC